MVWFQIPNSRNFFNLIFLINKKNKKFPNQVQLGFGSTGIYNVQCTLPEVEDFVGIATIVQGPKKKVAT
jgi:hypothetical protein